MEQGWGYKQGKAEKGLERDWEGERSVVYENFRFKEVPFP